LKANSTLDIALLLLHPTIAAHLEPAFSSLSRGVSHLGLRRKAANGRRGVLARELTGVLSAEISGIDGAIQRLQLLREARLQGGPSQVEVLGGMGAEIGSGLHRRAHRLRRRITGEMTGKCAWAHHLKWHGRSPERQKNYCFRPSIGGE
jgi:hypothetical protein